ncbi:MAG TPA: hypothetical protein PKA20_05255 [Burkholderiaceae bacterium]|nr:hypothetical protein [Burkholderiaceae bacterium]
MIVILIFCVNARQRGSRLAPPGLTVQMRISIISYVQEAGRRDRPAISKDGQPALACQPAHAAAIAFQAVRRHPACFGHTVRAHAGHADVRPSAPFPRISHPIRCAARTAEVAA